ncbi:MAG: GNAT family N-acetyltransferase [Sphingomonadaceae bacterium]|nr:GNAT family N-acetyltransferase [Sphingomonadaceae bacterium]
MVNVKIFDSLDAVARDAEGALDRARQAKIYDRLDWFRLTEAHIAQSGKPLIARALNAGGTAWLFLRETAPGRAEGLGSWYTLDYDAIRTGTSPDVLGAIPDALRELTEINLYPVNDPAPIAEAFRGAGWKVRVTRASVNWLIDPPASFDEYWAGRPGKLRNTVKRKAKKAGLEIAIHRAFDESAWRDYETIYARSWKGEEGSPAFLRALAQQEGEAGTLRLGVAYREGAPVAAQFWLVENGHATIHKLAYDESAKELSPGSILGEAMFRHVIERDAPKQIDYGTGDEPYKAEWMARARPLYRIEMLNPRQPRAWPKLARRAVSGLVRRPTSD